MTSQVPRGMAFQVRPQNCWAEDLGRGSPSTGKKKGGSHHRDSPTSLHGAHLLLGRETIFIGLRGGLPGLAVQLRGAHWPTEGTGTVPREGSDHGPELWPQAPGLAKAC